MPFAVSDDVQVSVLAFVRDRLYVLLRDQGLPHDVVAAVLDQRSHDPYRAAATAQGLARLMESPDWPELLVAYARTKRIVRNLSEQYSLASEHYVEPAARDLYAAWQAAEARLSAASADEKVVVLGEALRDLREPINRFFTDLLVMADDPAVRQARLALLQRIAALPDGIADLSQLQGF
jgi:glycyl-tRNA synthetase beta subunit